MQQNNSPRTGGCHCGAVRAAINTIAWPPAEGFPS